MGAPWLALCSACWSNPEFGQWNDHETHGVRKLNFLLSARKKHSSPGFLEKSTKEIIFVVFFIMPLYIPETFYPQTTTIIETKQLRDSGHKSMANLGCPALVTCSKNPLIVSTGQTLEPQGIQKRHAILKTAEPGKKNSPPKADPRYSARAHPSASPGSSGISAWHVATR